MDGIPGEWSIAPGSHPERVLLFFHGGGYCSGSIVSHRRMVTEAGRAGAVRTLAVAYRLAPEHPFPAALDDALTAWRFLRRQGVAARSIAVGGDSAGGGLTVALVNKLKELGDELPGCMWLVSPWTDLTMSGETLTSKDAVDPLIHKPYLRNCRPLTTRPPCRRIPCVGTLGAYGLHRLSSRLISNFARRWRPLRPHAEQACSTLEVWPHMIMLGRGNARLIRGQRLQRRLIPATSPLRRRWF